MATKGFTKSIMLAKGFTKDIMSAQGFISPMSFKTRMIVCDMLPHSAPLGNKALLSCPNMTAIHSALMRLVLVMVNVEHGLLCRKKARACSSVEKMIGKVLHSDHSVPLILR